MIADYCRRIAGTLLVLMFCVADAHAVLTIKITQGIERALPIAIVPFGLSKGTPPPPIEVTEVIVADLANSGRFAPLPEKDLPSHPHEFSEINFQNWRMLGMETLVVGNLSSLQSGNYDIEFRLVDVYKGTQLAGYRVSSPASQLRRAAHHISDIIFEKLTGIRGAFSTRIAYVTVSERSDQSKTYELQVADADGYNPQTLLESPQPLISPAWSPDGRRIAYVSFEGKNSTIYVQDVQSGSREKVASNPGLNSAPAVSPDGGRLAMTLSKDGNAEIYILHVSSGLLRRVTNDAAIDTEPAWSPDGSQLAFTSDRSGGPQIYEVDLRGGRPERLTFEGPYHARPVYSPDGKHIAMIHGESGSYRIAVLERDTGSLRILTDTRLDESPSFAPNGSMIIYATVGQSGTELAAISVDGRVRQRLALQEGEVREPAWGPFITR
ncbi:MAG: Tol-Pal system beta propeller repeat protein TolB [Gammaproteobacteria bacterium]|nr:Tol-Pal system beta propeller repeat protein TolB [Gammaproteobacteria bacterium]